MPIKLDQKISEGRLSFVYRGTYSGQPAIFKQLKPGRADDAAAATFRHEYDLACEVSSPYITAPLAFAAIDGFPVQIYADIGAESVAKLLASRRLGVREVLAIGLDVARALTDLHRARITHRDVNPNNIVANVREGRAQLIDLGIATRLLRERSANDGGNLEGTLAYISPEQTGRMNRSVDFRTDLYSLGASLYEMLTGQVPFAGGDALETVHMILALAPKALAELRPDVPAVVSSLVMKLLEKDPERRYQSARGLAHDLELVLADLDGGAAGAPFSLGGADYSESFTIPERLYGREADLAHLTAAIDRIVGGSNELVLVSGPSGIGKSALVNELRAAVTNCRGRLVSGKFDQLKRNVPYSAVTQAFNQLVRQILSQDQESVEAWRKDLAAAVGDLGQVVIDIVPMLRGLLGPQAPAPEVDPEQSLTRLMALLGGLIGVFARRQHPLLIFLDDVQWADAGSLAVLRYLTGADGPAHLMVIAAYRDNEVTASHPTMIEFTRIRKERGDVLDVVVAPLGGDAVAALVADTLRCTAAEAQDLTAVVMHKTGGNPFFIRAFLGYLYDQGLIELSFPSGRWIWRIDAIRQQRITDNVVELLVDKLATLSSETKQTLMYAACVGQRFDLKTLAFLMRLPPSEVAALLWQPVQTGFVLPVAGDLRLAHLAVGATVVYQFAHDRIQQAVHSLLPDEKRSATHLHMARILSSTLSDKERAERHFEIVDHYNLGEPLVTDADERHRLAELNAAAGRQAQLASAFGPAVRYLQTAERLLGAELKSAESLKFTVQMGLARSYHAVGQTEDGLAILRAITETSPSVFEKASAYELTAALHEARAEYTLATEACLKGLALFGFSIKRHVSYFKLTYEAMKLRIVNREAVMRSIEAEPTSVDDRWRAILELVSRAIPSTYLANPNLFAVLTIKLFDRARREGVRPAHPTFTMILSGIFYILKDPGAGKRLCEAAYGMRSFSGESARSMSFFYVSAGHWSDVYTKSYRDCVAVEEKAYVKALELGNRGDAGVGAFLMHLNALAGGYLLPDFLKMAEQFRPFFAKQLDHYSYSFFFATVQTARAMAGETRAPDSLSDEHVDEEVIRKHALCSPGNTAIFDFMRTWVDFHVGRYDLVVKRALRNPLPLRLPGCFSACLSCFFIAVAVLRSRIEGRPAIKSSVISWLVVAVARLEPLWWERSSASVMTGLARFIAAEAARVRGRTQLALVRYEAALAQFIGSKQHYFAAFAHETLARYYRELDLAVPAAAHAHEAIERFEQFGAKPRVETLRREFSLLLETRAAQSVAELAGSANRRSLSMGQTNPGTAAGLLDMDSIIKASQAISGQVDLDRLVTDMLRIVMENAGADRGAVITVEGDRTTVKVAGFFRGADFRSDLVDRPFEQGSGDYAPAGLVNYVLRTGEEVVINSIDPAADYAGDPFVVQCAPQSFVCLPIKIQGRTAAVILLANTLLEHAFTHNRIRTLQILAAQGAISLRNAEYVRELKDSVAKIDRLRGRLEKILAGTKAMAACRSLEAAVAVAIKTITDEVESVRGARMSLVVAGRSGSAPQISPLLGDGRFDRSAVLGRVEDAAYWVPYLERSGILLTETGSVVLSIRHDDKPLGLLIFDGAGARPLAAEDAQFIETLSQSLALSMATIDYQEHLEDLVAERTAALRVALVKVEEKQSKIQAILEHIDLGILTFGAALTADDEFSTRLPDLCGETAPAISGKAIVPLVFNASSLTDDERSRTEEVLKVVVGEDLLNWQLNSGLLPHEVNVTRSGAARVFALGWNPIVGEGDLVDKMMLTIKDVTDQRELERRTAEADQRQARKMAVLAEMLAVDRLNLQRFLTSTEELFAKARTAAEEEDLLTLFRVLHTIKGSAAIVGLKNLVTLAHEAETLILNARTQSVGTPIGPAFFDERLAGIAAELSYYRAVFDEVFAQAAGSTSLRTLQALAADIRSRIAAVSAESGMDFARFDVSDRVPTWNDEMLGAVAEMLPHCINNSLDHGYVLPRKAGKSVRPIDIAIVAEARAGGVCITVEDRGVGLDHAKIHVLAERAGIAAADHLEVLFQESVSTASEVSLTSGRGIGLGAVRSLAREQGGDVVLTDRDGGGTKCIITLNASSFSRGDAA